MTHNNNFNPLPWYTSLEQQNHRKNYAYGRIYPLYTQANFMLPWQLRTTLTGEPEFILFEIYHEDGTLYQEVISSSIASNMTFIPSSGGMYVVFRPLFPIVSSQPDGRYYAKLTLTDDNSNSVTYYSEVYTVVQSLDGYLKIEWYDTDDLDVVRMGSMPHPTIENFAASPDALVYVKSTGEVVAVVETKVPLPKTFMQYRCEVTDAASLKATNDKYYFQVHAEMMVSETRYAFFAAYQPFLNDSLHVAGIEMNEATAKDIEERIALAEEFIAAH